MNPFISALGDWWFLLPVAYLTGSVPFGLLISKFIFGIDPRQSGSGNIGMTNVMRTVGKLPGILTFICDFGKGFAFPFIYRFSSDSPDNSFVLILAAAAILGHIHSIFLKFRGGKGVATGFGAWTGFNPVIGVGGMLSWLALYLIFRVSSIAGMISSVTVTLLVAYVYGFHAEFLFSLALTSYIIFLHRSNISRILQGKEMKMTRKK